MNSPGPGLPTGGHWTCRPGWQTDTALDVTVLPLSVVTEVTAAGCGTVARVTRSASSVAGNKTTSACSWPAATPGTA